MAKKISNQSVANIIAYAKKLIHSFIPKYIYLQRSMMKAMSIEQWHSCQCHPTTFITTYNNNIIKFRNTHKWRKFILGNLFALLPYKLSHPLSLLHLTASYLPITCISTLILLSHGSVH